MNSEGNDPNGWLHLIAGGVLAAMGKRIWSLLSNTPRPARAEHSNAYIEAEIRAMREAVDRIDGTVSGLDHRLKRLERASSGD